MGGAKQKQSVERERNLRCETTWLQRKMMEPKVCGQTEPPCKLDALQPLPLVVQVQVEGAGEEEWKLQKENLISFP